MRTSTSSTDLSLKDALNDGSDRASATAARDATRDPWVPLAEVARPHGVRGELRLKVYNAESDTLLKQEEVLVRMPDGLEHEVSVDTARRADDAILLKLYSVDDRDRADELRGAVICVRRSALLPPAEGEFYVVDVIGAEARLEGARLGVVTEIVSYPTIDAMRVKTDDGKSWEIPMSDTFVGRVDPATKLVEIVSLEGLEADGPRVPKPKPERPERPRRGPRAPKPAPEK